LNILILGVQVPFTSGGAELLSLNLQSALRKSGHTVDIVQLPFTAIPKSEIAREMKIWRALNLDSFGGRDVDLVIPTKFPSYLVKHRRKVVWMVHQLRQAYELLGTRYSDFEPTIEDEALRQLIFEYDREALREAQALFTISANVSSRIKRFFSLDSTPLRPARPNSEVFPDVAEPKPYVLSVGRICSMKRVDLLVRAVPRLDPELVIKIVGTPDEPNIQNYLNSEISKHCIGNRVEFLGGVSSSQLAKLYAEATAVCYLPFDEDYGFVTLEARAHGIPVVTTSDSGGVLEFIKDGVNGIVCEPSPDSVATSINRLYRDSDLSKKLRFKEYFPDLVMSYEKIAERLTSPVGRTLRENTVEEKRRRVGQ
jgi:glycosyltransferase involved in cell wall biosynthesis